MSFDGFPTPSKNFFSMPNAITDIIANITNMAELKVIIYVIRHTWGFHEYGKPKAISVDEFMNGRKRNDGKTRMDKGTGLSHHSVIEGLRRAVDHGYLICDVDDSDLARVKKSYALKMMSTSEDVAPGEEFAPPEKLAPGAKSSKSSAESASRSEDVALPMEDSAPRSEKYTLRNTPKKYTQEIQGSGARVDEASGSGFAIASPPAWTSPQSGDMTPYRPTREEHQALLEEVSDTLNEAEQIRIAADITAVPCPEPVAISSREAHNDVSIHASSSLVPVARPETGTRRPAPGVPDRVQRSVPAAEAATSQGVNSRGATSASKGPKEPAQISLIPEQKPLSPEAEVDQCFRWLDEVRQELTGDPMASYVANGANKKRLADLIKACRGTSNVVIERHVKMAWTAMWNAGTFKDGTSWRTPGRLTINAFCNNYGSYLDLARDEQRKRDVGIGASGMRRWSPPPVIKKNLEELKSEWTKKEARING